MVAADDGAERDITATATMTAALRTDVFELLTARLGAYSDVQRARLIGVDRATIRRMRKREFAPRLTLAMHMAECLGTTVDELFEQVDMS